ncbi:MAG: succinate dehydrogenase iron-sulfur subunit [Nitrososphaeraceae archaeon]|nr:succinate dehydrogenase iron-sulfur subunit [Nitrososphaeraceae archaeon]MDW0193508.1 succinate dehydrogenase iron-sulfur subunit [Nitrososphaeraceae archaeon]MDW0246282.1 succinate dehydrogenase iron-sulfur subunit [Nitrososphaeraceae archaeon]MDW0269979.1 succinate dehydrogenase iron-sulfur subunit [Nitrososphaeraceae archaeon]MDW3644228.1 succinate dehydrogenase iron-sulfur subunit [Nitrososphaeraceae archaeon]
MSNTADSKSNNNINNVNEQRITLKVYRENRSQKTGSHYDTFEVPYKKWTTVLDALLYVKSYIDPSVAIRYSCRMASCGSCGMKINGIPKLACYTKISELETSIIECAPLSNFPIIRDLVTDFSQFFNHHKDMQPYLQAKDNLETDTNKGTFSFYQSPEDVDKYLQFSYCIKCGLCYSACPTVGTDLKFPGPQALAQQYRYFADTRDESKNRLDIVDDRHGIWRCHFAGSCSKVCPKGVDPALGIQLLRSYVLGISKNDKVPAKRIEINNNANTEDSAIDSNS